MHKSPNGKYTLEIENIPTKPGCWDRTVGKISCDGKPLTEVRRNYSSFPFLWVEHPNGHEYLICGENYQGQTVIELDTLKRRDFLPPEAKQGAGFCWVDYTFHAKTQMLVVSGCIWACPYEFRFYDFSDPMGGWSEIEVENGVDADHKAPEISDDGTVIVFESRMTFESIDDDNEDRYEVVASRTLKRNGLKFDLVSSWIDSEEVVRREEAEKAYIAWDEAWKKYKAEDPMYLRVVERIKRDGFDPIVFGSVSVGSTYDGWCSHWKGQEGRVCCRIRKNISLEWGRESAPVKLIVNGKDFWFEHSVQGIDQAFDRVLKEIS